MESESTENNIMIKLLIFLVVMALSISCTIRHADGGPCSYEETPFETVVMRVSPDKSHPEDSMYYVRVRPFGGPYRDSMLLNDMLDGKINISYIRGHDIKPGKVIKGTMFTIKKGTCNPLIYMLE
jgi:hypothetical protein